MIRGICRSAAAAGLAIALATAAFAGPIADKAGEAERLIGSGDAAGALAAFDAATAAFWEASPLQLRVATFAEAIHGFANYQARSDAAFHAADTMQIYLEPVGFGFAEENGDTRVALSVGTEIRQGDVVLGKIEDLGKYEWHGTRKNYDIDVAINLSLPELKPGDYSLVLTIKDDVASKSAEITLPFSIVE